MDIKQAGKALWTVVEQILAPMVGRRSLAMLLGYRENAGVPSAVVPEFIGQRLFDTTNSVFYVAYGVAAGEWNLTGLPAGLSTTELSLLNGAGAANDTASVAAVLDSTKSLTTTVGVGAKNGATVTAVERGVGNGIQRTVLTCAATPVTITDDPGIAQYGGAGKIYGFPQGLIQVLGAVIDGAVTLGTTGTIINTWAGGVALGSATATTGATLIGTEADIMAEVNVAAATLKVAVVDAVSVANTALMDGTTTAKDLYLNLVVDDDATHTSGTGTFTGTVTITWANYGNK